MVTILDEMKESQIKKIEKSAYLVSGVDFILECTPELLNTSVCSSIQIQTT